MSVAEPRERDADCDFIAVRLKVTSLEPLPLVGDAVEVVLRLNSRE